MSDFFATFIDVAGAKKKDNINGISFFPMIKGNKSPRQWAYSESKKRSWVRTKDYKLYNNGFFAEVSSTEPGKETKVSRPLNTQQKTAFQLLSEASKPLLK